MKQQGEQCAWQKNSVQHIEFSGVLTRSSVPQLWKQRQQWLQGTEPLQLNLGQVSKIDSAGVAMLLETKRELLAQQRDLEIIEATDQLRAMVRVSGVGELLQIN